jgi:hypothetical protein
MLERYANFSERSKHHGVRFFVMMKWSNSLSSSGKAKMLVFTRKLVEAL